MNKTIEILLIEDNPSDILITKEAFKNVVSSHNLNVVHDGEEALAFLNKVDNYKNSPTPSLILLDLNLPKKSGYEVLSEIRASEILKQIPVIILTTVSNAARSLYSAHASSYLKKPMDYDNFVNMILSIEDFWLKNVEFPR